MYVSVVAPAAVALVAVTTVSMAVVAVQAARIKVNTVEAAVATEDSAAVAEAAAAACSMAAMVDDREVPELLIGGTKPSRCHYLSEGETHVLMLCVCMIYAAVRLPVRHDTVKPNQRSLFRTIYRHVYLYY